MDDLVVGHGSSRPLTNQEISDAAMKLASGMKPMVTEAEARKREQKAKREGFMDGFYWRVANDNTTGCDNENRAEAEAERRYGKEGT